MASNDVIRQRRNILLRTLSGLGIASLTTLLIANERSDKSTFRLSELISVFFDTIVFSKRFRNVFLLSILSTGVVRFFANITNRLTITFLQVLGFCYTSYYFIYMGEAPRIRCKKTLFNQQLIHKAKLSEKYWPCFLLPQGDVMTVLGSMLNTLSQALFYDIPHEQTLLTSCDGINTIPLDWYVNVDEPLKKKDDSAPIVVLVHGLGGGTDASYLKKFAHASHRKGFRVCSYDWWRLDFGEWRDLNIIINHLAKENPIAPISLIAVSAGTHISLRYLQESGESSPLVAAIMVSPVQDLMEEYRLMQANPKRVVYRDFVDRTLKTMAHRSLNTDVRDWPKRKSMLKALSEEKDTNRLYDSIIYNSCTYSNQGKPGVFVSKPTLQGIERPMFCGTEDHYTGLVRGKYHMIKVTTLILHAKDDPILMYDSLDWHDIQNNKNIISVVTKRGGHVAWEENMIPAGESWANRISLRFISSILEMHATTNFILSVVKTERDNHVDGSKSNMPRNLSARIARICSLTDVSKFAEE
eukprot:g9726.t1